MSGATEVIATLDDLYRVEGEAELIAGKIVHFLRTGRVPSRVASRIFRSLDDHAQVIGRGEAYNDNLSSGRQSFSPDASYSLGPFPANGMRFIEGPPTLAVEVRSEGDYGEAAEAAMAVKRADNFEAGTLVVRDVDPVADLIQPYRAGDPARPDVFAPGQEGDAEPVPPGWRMAAGRIFR